MKTDVPFVSNEYGIFRADYLEDLKQAKLRHWEETKEQRRADAFTQEQMIAELVEGMRKKSRLDSVQTNFVARSLLHVLSGLKTITHPGDILAQGVMPISTEGGTGLSSIAYQELDLNGKFRPLAGSAKDLHEVGSTLTETIHKVHTYAAAMSWTQVDLERSAKAMVNLSDRKQRAVALAASKLKNQIAWNGDEDGLDLNGLFDYTLDQASITGTWASATTDAILGDLLTIATKCEKNTEDFVSDVMVMDTTSHTYLYKPRNTNTDTSIAQYLLNNTPIKAIYKTSYLNSVTSATNSLSANRVILAYPNNQDILMFSMPRDVQYFPVERDGLTYEVPVLMDIAGTIAFKAGSGGPITYAVPS